MSSPAFACLRRMAAITSFLRDRPRFSSPICSAMSTRSPTGLRLRSVRFIGAEGYVTFLNVEARDEQRRIAFALQARANEGVESEKENAEEVGRERSGMESTTASRETSIP